MYLEHEGEPLSWKDLFGGSSGSISVFFFLVLCCFFTVGIEETISFMSLIRGIVLE